MADTAVDTTTTAEVTAKVCFIQVFFFLLIVVWIIKDNSQKYLCACVSRQNSLDMYCDHLHLASIRLSWKL